MKGGISETRIEKRIVISGDADIDHDEVRPHALMMEELLSSFTRPLHFPNPCEFLLWNTTGF